MGLAEDSPLWSPVRIPYPATPSAVPGQAESAGEETPSMIDLVREIDAHVEAADPEVTSDNRTEDVTAQLPEGQPRSPAPSPSPTDPAV